MIEVTCGACGTAHRFADGDVPAAGKTVTCARCKARIHVPGAAPAFELGAPGMSGGTGDRIDLAELPAPKRPAGRPPGPALTGPPPVSTPIPKIDLDDLVAGVTESIRAAPPKPNVALPPIPSPANKPPPIPARPATPRPGTAPAGKGLDFDLPAPVGPAGTKGIVDLPAPVGPAGTKGIVDLPAPVGPAGTKGIVDLPAPVGPAGTKGVVDLPAPVGPAGTKGVVDLPAPVGPAGTKGIVDLPAPVGPAGTKGIVDLPTPVSAPRVQQRIPAVPSVPATSTVRGMTPLEPIAPAPPAARAPARPQPAPARPAPDPQAKPTLDFLGEDLDAAMTPAAIGLDDGAPPGDIDLPVPKGFFDDIPQPAMAPDLLAPVGPVPSGELPAPKGFFDDIPQPARSQNRGSQPVPAVKPGGGGGFFDDMPAATPGGGSGFFDDMPAATPGGGSGFFDDAPATSNRALDLDDLDLAPPSAGPSPSAAPPLDFGSDLGPSGPRTTHEPPAFDLGDGPSLDLDAPAVREPQLSPPPAATRPPPTSMMRGPMAGSLDLDAAAPVPALELPESGHDLGGLDLPSMPASTGGVVSFKPPTSRIAPMAHMPPPGGAFDLDIDESKAKPKPVTRAIPVRPGGSAAAPAGIVSTRRKRRIFVAFALVAAAAAAGGFYGYHRWQTEQDRIGQVENDIDHARRHLGEATANHWKQAATSAEHALSLDHDNVVAAALAAQGHLGGYLDEGTDGKHRLVAGGDLVQTLIASGKRDPDVDKAQALKSIIDGQTERAVQRLDGVLRGAPQDVDALLYLGWAKLAAEDWQGAVEAFDRGLPLAKKRDIPFHYGRGQAKLGLGDRDAARADFAAVIDRDKDHVGAQVGLAAAAPLSDFARREADLLALLERKDIAKADPRAVVRAWTLAGDDARRAGRLDAARDRYRKALTLQPGAVPAIVGEAETELRDGNVEAASAAAERALRKSSDDVAANLVAAEIDLRRGKSAEARTRLEQLRTRTPPIQSPQDKARLLLLTGAELELDPTKATEALAAYDEARALLGTTDVGPSIAAARLLAKLAEKATGADAADYRKRADALLAPLSAQAEANPSTAIALGVAYLAAEDPTRAEAWLRKSIAARPADVEGRFQLAAALDKLKRHDEALLTYRAAFDLDPSRIDVGMALARGYEESGKVADASAMYDKLIGGKDVSVEVRIRAGRFWARTGDVEKARAQGKAIAAVDADNAGGLFLQAEGLYADKKYLEARRLYQQAVDAEPDAQYLDGLGRATEMLAAAQGDSRYKDEALRAYTQANELDPRLLSSLIGRGRLHLERRDAAKALEALNAANAVKPGDADVQYGIGVAYQETKNRKEAISWLSRSVASRPRAEAYYRLGILHFDLDAAREAAASLWSAVQLATDDERRTGTAISWLTDALYMLGTIENTLRHDAQTCRAWSQYLSRSPTNQTQSSEVRRVMLGLRCH